MSESLVLQTRTHARTHAACVSQMGGNSSTWAFVFLLPLLIISLLFIQRAFQPPLSLYRDDVPLQTPPTPSLHPPRNPHLSSPVSDPFPKTKSPDTLIVGNVHTSSGFNSSADPFSGSIPSSGPVSGSNSSSSGAIVDRGKSNAGMAALESAESCDLYMGKWIRDEHYPIYKPGSCPYVDEAFSCQGNGRSDSEYLRWRWKPDDCDLPRFNATDFLLKLRGKRLMLVGDSMNRNQFESILCLLREGVTNKSRLYEIHGYKITKGRGYFVFTFLDYNCTVEFVRSHFLVREGVRISGRSSNPTLSVDQIDKSAKRWKSADILVFNTGHWWAHGKTARGKNYFKEGDNVYPQFDVVEAYRRALNTWANWIDQNVDPAKQLVFYRGYSSAHFRGGDWDSGGTCNGEADPVRKGAILNNYPVKMKIVEEVIQKMTTPVILLNITRLTNFRKDGHPSVYGKKTTLGRKVSTRKQDCSHWCLPGVPDAWNELIYATLISQQSKI